jgi:DNA polymerase-3 subunit delta'
MTFEELKVNQKEVIKILENSYRRNRLVHSYIFEGEKGVGKLMTATYLAMLLLCKSEKKPCFECSDCKKVLNRSHLNVYFIEPDGDSIKKNQIEDLLYEFSMTSLESGSRIYIINEADKMNTSAANSLLKFLEEPRGDNYAILITEKPQFILDTIKSRSQVISFRPINKESLISYLIKKGVNPKISFILSNITANVDQALELINGGEILDIIELVEKLNRAKYSNMDIYPTFFTSSDFLFKSTNKDIHRLFIDVMVLYEQEKVKYLNNGESPYLGDFFKELNLNSKEKNISLVDRLNIYIKYQERLNYNVNLDLFYSSLFLEI